MNKNSYLFSLALVSSLMLAPFSFAQDDADVEEVVVTGSKIKGSDLYSFAPITEITQEDHPELSKSFFSTANYLYPFGILTLAKIPPANANFLM